MESEKDYIHATVIFRRGRVLEILLIKKSDLILIDHRVNIIPAHQGHFEAIRPSISWSQ